MTEDIRVEFMSGPDADPEEIDALTRALRAEILEVEEVDRVEQATAGPAPDGSKGLDVAAIGALVVGIAPGAQAVAKVIEVVRGWLANRSSSTPPLQMSIGDKTITVVADKEQQEELVAAFIAALRTADTDATGQARGVSGSAASPGGRSVVSGVELDRRGVAVERINQSVMPPSWAGSSQITLGSSPVPQVGATALPLSVMRVTPPRSASPGRTRRSIRSDRAGRAVHVLTSPGGCLSRPVRR